MRTLKFIVDGQEIKQDPTCDFSNLYPTAYGCIIAEFSFSKEWEGCHKVAGFYSPLGKEYPPRVLSDGMSCVIPHEALRRRSFKIQMNGMRGDLRLQTNKAVVRQEGGL